jgi:hypothetical protein
VPQWQVLPCSGLGAGLGCRGQALRAPAIAAEASCHHCSSLLTAMQRTQHSRAQHGLADLGNQCTRPCALAHACAYTQAACTCVCHGCCSTAAATGCVATGAPQAAAR